MKRWYALHRPVSCLHTTRAPHVWRLGGVVAWAGQIESMRAFARDSVAFLPDHMRLGGVAADHVRDTFADDELDGDRDTALRLWPKALAQLRTDSRIQVQERVSHGRQRMFMCDAACARRMPLRPRPTLTYTIPPPSPLLLLLAVFYMYTQCVDQHPASGACGC